MIWYLSSFRVRVRSEINKLSPGSHTRYERQLILLTMYGFQFCCVPSPSVRVTYLSMGS
jgi:hypothetical protein